MGVRLHGGHIKSHAAPEAEQPPPEEPAAQEPSPVAAEVRRLLGEQVGRLLHGHHVDPMLDMQVTLGICIFLISVTIGFELGKHKLEHEVPPIMTSVMNAMFGELTVLGFIALVAYMMLRSGVIEALSLIIYEDGEHLIHLFEDIHFMLFFVMLTFLVQACVFVLATLKAEAIWITTEQFMANFGYPKPGSSEEHALIKAVASKLENISKENRKRRLLGLLPTNLVWWYREKEARDDLTYALMRDRFVSQPPKPNKPALPPDFDFATYLRHRCIHEVAHVLHVGADTWAMVRRPGRALAGCTLVARLFTAGDHLPVRGALDHRLLHACETPVKRL